MADEDLSDLAPVFEDMQKAYDALVTLKRMYHAFFNASVYPNGNMKFTSKVSEVNEIGITHGTAHLLTVEFSRLNRNATPGSSSIYGQGYEIKVATIIDGHVEVVLKEGQGQTKEKNLSMRNSDNAITLANRIFRSVARSFPVIFGPELKGMYDVTTRTLKNNGGPS